jgi:hypothetical protein
MKKKEQSLYISSIFVSPNYSLFLDFLLKAVGRFDLIQEKGAQKPKVVYWIYFCSETHFDLRCLTVVGKSITNECQSKNSTPATPRLCKHNRDHAFYCSSGGHTDVATSWYLY